MTDLSTNITNRLAATQASQIKEVWVINDFGISVVKDITLASKLYQLMDQIVTDNALIVDDVLLGNLGALNFTVNQYIYTGSGTWLSTAPNSGALGLFVNILVVVAFLPNAIIHGSVGTSPENTQQGAVAAIFASSVFIGASLGKLENYSLVTYDIVGFRGYTNGHTFTDCIEVSILNFECVSNGFGTGPTFTIEGNTGESFIGPGVFRIASGEQGVRIDPGISDAARIQVQGVKIENGAPLFDTSPISGKENGTFTAIANVSFTDTAISSVEAGSVISGGNAAQFNSTALVYVNQIVTITEFVTNTTYNVTGRVTVSTPGSSFELLNVLNHSSETVGKVSSDTITVTDVGTVLEDGDSLVLDTTGSTAYDGGGVVYNQLDDSFQINRAHAGATAVGTWNTKGLDQKDPRVLAFNNPNFIASKYIICGFVNTNGAETVISNNDFIDFTLSGFAASSNSERWKLIDAPTATFEYTGNEGFDGSINFTVSADKINGSNSSYKFKYVKSTDGGSVFIDLTDNVETSIILSNLTSNSTSMIIPLTANKGDQIKPQLQSVSDTNNNVIVIDFSCYGIS